MKKWKTSDIESHENDTIRLIDKEAYSQNPLQRFTRRYWEWMYCRSPGGKAITKIALSGKKTVGHYSVIPIEFSNKGKTFKAAISVDSVTDPGYRRQGIFTGLADAVYKEADSLEIKFIYGFGNKYSHPGFIQKLQWKHLGNVPQLVMLIKPKKALQTKIGILSTIAAMPFHVKNAMARKCKNSKDCYTIKEFGPETDAMWNRIKNKTNTTKRDSKFCNWRFINTPRNYKSFGSGKNLEAYITVRVAELYGIKTGAIIDWIYSTKEQGEKVLSHAISALHNEGCDMATVLMQKNTEHYRLLKKYGFIKIPETIHPRQWKLGVLHESRSPEFKDWFITLADFDVL